MTTALSLLEEFKPPLRQEPLTPTRHLMLCEEAYQRGLEDGLEQAKTETAAATLEALKHLSETINDSTAFRENAIKKLERDFGAALASIVRVLCPALKQRKFPEAVREFVNAELSRAPRPFTMRAPPDLTEALNDVFAGVDGIDSIEADARLTGSQLEIAWPDGFASLNTEQVAAEILQLADQIEGAEAPEKEEEHV